MTELDDRVRELLQACTLRDVLVREFNARLRLDGEEIPEHLGEDDATLNLGMGYVVAEQGVDFHFVVSAETRAAEAGATVLVRYEMDASSLSEDVAVHFANRVAFMTAYPYLREIIHSSTNRLPGIQPLLLPIVQDPPGFTRTENAS